MRKTVQISWLIQKEYPDLDFSDKTIDRLTAFLEQLERWNRKINLTAIRGTQQLAVKHILDSLALFKGDPEQFHPSVLNGQILDIGSGAGLPGIVLAIVCSKTEVLSIDKSIKKIGFQKNVKANLKIANVVPMATRLDELSNRQDLTESFDYIVSRAFTQIKGILDAAIFFLKPAGKLILWKGPNWENEMKAVDPEKWRTFSVSQHWAYRFESDRFGGRIVVIEKN